jgi:enoyl-[acyl-carrier protein] reductase I
MDITSESLLAGRKGLVVGIANPQSIAYGCARMFRRCGAELAVTWLNEKARPHVEPLAQELAATIAMPLDVERAGDLEAVFEAIRSQWGRLDFVLHSIAFAPAADLHGRVADSSREGFARAMDISCHSFFRMARLAEPLMPDGGTLLTMSYLGAAEVVPHYGVMGPVKAALEASVRYPRDRARATRHPRQRGVARADAHPRRERHPRLRRPRGGRPQPRATAARSRNRRRGLALRVPRERRGARGHGDVHYIDGGLHILA